MKVFYCTCLSFCPQGGVCLSACGDTPPGQTPPLPEQTPSWADTPCPVHAGIHTPHCPVHPGIHCPVLAGIDMATAAGDTHHTRMHSSYHPQRSWGKVIFSVVCVKNSVQGGEYLGRYTPTGRYTPRAGTPPRQVHPLGRYTPGKYTPGRYTPQSAGTPPRSSACWEIRAKADGAHPTGMHSCYEIIS